MEWHLREWVAALFMALALVPAQAADDSAGAKGSWSIGSLWGKYAYDEPGEMNLRGHRFGLDLSYAGRLEDDGFWGWNAWLAQGRNTYVGTGTMHNVPEKVVETRFTGGRAFPFDGYALAPYVGIGYRINYSDFRGTTSTGARGYRRMSQYLYVPIGVTHRLPLGEAHLSTTLEYELFLQGKQTSYLSDVGPAFQDVSNRQNSGFGLKGLIAYEMRHWSYGVFISYWKISQSEPANFVIGNSYWVAYEPNNTTISEGIIIKYRF